MNKLAFELGQHMATGELEKVADGALMHPVLPTGLGLAAGGLGGYAAYRKAKDNPETADTAGARGALAGLGVGGGVATGAMIAQLANAMRQFPHGVTKNTLPAQAIKRLLGRSSAIGAMGGVGHRCCAGWDPSSTRCS